MSDFILRTQARFLLKPALALVPSQWVLRKLFALHLALAERAPRGVAVTQTTIADVPGLMFTPKGVTGPAQLLYLHGGGFTIGSPRTHKSLVARMAQEMGVVAFAPDYRLAPEHPFPAAHDDTLAVYDALATEAPIAVAGDSAGGNLAAYLCTVREPVAAALLSPVVDFTRLDRGVDFSGELVIPRAWAERAIAAIAAPNLADARLSPLSAARPGTPTLIHVGAEEALRWDADALAEAMGASVEHFPGLPHVWQMFGSWSSSARRSITGLASFLKEHL